MDINDEPKIGETWYVQLGKGSTLSEKIVTDITPRTVELKEPPKAWQTKPSRYVRSEVKFIEVVK